MQYYSDEEEIGDTFVTERQRKDKCPPKYLVHNDNLYYRRKYYSRNGRNGRYYICRNQKICNCKGSLFVTESSVSLISEHVDECAERATLGRVSEFEDEEFLFGLNKLRRENPDKLPCALIQAFFDGHPKLSDKLNRYDRVSCSSCWSPSQKYGLHITVR